jgi:ABC-type sugar transport system ATPase subunit
MLRRDGVAQPGAERRAVGDDVGVPNGAGPVLEVRGLVKHYGEVRALEGVDFDLHASEILALVGQNGAGKSTLSKMVAGFVSPDAGSIVLNGRDITAVGGSRTGGIAIVAQELSIVPTASVAENVFLGSKRRGIWRGARLTQEALPFLRRLGLDELDPGEPASRLTVAEAQLVEIARVLARDARIVIFDEPTASLSDTEIARVEAVVRDLAAEGRAIIYVTHRLAEVMQFCDAALVLRDGREVARLATATTPLSEIVTHMLGRPLESLFPESGAVAGAVVFEARQLSGRGLMTPLNIELREGEITGLAGQLGSGASAALRLLGGFDKATGGAVLLNGAQLRLGSPNAAVRSGILYCTDDRKRDGFFPARSVTENLSALSLPALSRGTWIMRGRERAFAAEAADFLGIDRRRMRASVSALSGGNQQKVVLGKLACRQPPPKVLLMLAPEPTSTVSSASSRTRAWPLRSHRQTWARSSASPTRSSHSSADARFRR